MNRMRLLASVIFIAVMATMWFSLKQKPVDPEQAAGNEEERAEYVAINLHRIVYDDEGRKTQTLSADRMTYYEAEDRAEFEAPMLLLESKNNKGKWQVSADSGVLLNNNRLLLKHNVNAVNLNESDYIDRIVSEYFRISLKDSTMQTEQPVRMFGDGLEIIGSGLVADLSQEKIDLTKHAKTIYQRN